MHAAPVELADQKPRQLFPGLHAGKVLRGTLVGEGSYSRACRHEGTLDPEEESGSNPIHMPLLSRSVL